MVGVCTAENALYGAFWNVEVIMFKLFDPQIKLEVVKTTRVIVILLNGNLLCFLPSSMLFFVPACDLRCLKYTQVIYQQTSDYNVDILCFV